MQEPIAPIKIAAQGLTTLQLPVIETSPANIPLTMAVKSILTFLLRPEIYCLVKKVRKPEVEAERIVFSIARDALSTLLVRPEVDPPLNNSQLNQRIIVPSTDSIGL
jgi:hypothetical protein